MSLMSSVELIKQAIATKNKANLPFIGKSMYPTLKDSMVVTINRILPEEVKISDIIAYQQDNLIAAHRVIDVIRDNGKLLFVTKGDNQPFGGIAQVRQSDLIGKIDKAFYKDSSEKDILNKNILYRSLFVSLGRVYLFYRRFVREHLPESLRIFFKAVVGRLYLALNFLTT